MNSKKYGHIVTLIWGMLFCFNLIMCLNAHNVRPISWIFAGFLLGGTFIMLLLNSIINAQDDLIDTAMKIIKKYSKYVDELKKKNEKTKKKA